jgi:hypothetical protein
MGLPTLWWCVAPNVREPGTTPRPKVLEEAVPPTTSTLPSFSEDELKSTRASTRSPVGCHPTPFQVAVAVTVAVSVSVEVTVSVGVIDAVGVIVSVSVGVLVGESVDVSVAVLVAVVVDELEGVSV